MTAHVAKAQMIEWLDTAVSAIEVNKECQPYPESGDIYRALQAMVRSQVADAPASFRFKEGDAVICARRPAKVVGIIERYRISYDGAPGWHAVDGDNLNPRDDSPETALRKIVDAYDAYRARGVAPAPNQYDELVKAIELARPALTRSDDPPKCRCDRCGRKTWEERMQGKPCGMPQPNGGYCAGTMTEIPA